VGKGVRVKVNFGQEPFKYKFIGMASLDEAQRKEIENRRKTALEAERVFTFKLNKFDSFSQPDTYSLFLFSLFSF
jgi:hypothetical protein